MSIIKAEKGRSSVCGKATKGAAQEEAGIFPQERSARNKKEVEESRGEKGSMHRLTAKSIARRIEKNSSAY